jgi:hypothetical protein
MAADESDQLSRNLGIREERIAVRDARFEADAAILSNVSFAR